MPKDLVVNIAGDGDISKVGFDFALTQTNADYIQQKLWIKFKTFLGELWLNIEQGIPYHEAVLVKDPDLQFINTVFKDTILEEPLIDSLLSFDITQFDTVNRRITFSWKALLTTGEIVEGEV